MPKREELRDFFGRMWDTIFGVLDEPTNPPDPSDPLPWDEWDLNPEFFAAMSRWTLEHPESTLNKILDKMCAAVDTIQPLFELIPDGAFPARGLVKAIAHLLQLSRTVTQAKREIHLFARQIIHWIGELKAALEDRRLDDGAFTEKTKKNLEERRRLINEICRWAMDRLNDDRWFQSSEKLAVGKEIGEFKVRMDAARELFMDLSMVNVSKGLDRVLKGQRKISREIKLVRKLQGEQLSEIKSRLIAIQSQREEQKRAEDRRQFMDRMLQRYTVENPTYDSQGKRPCDPDTRVEILADIQTWVSDFSAEGKNFLWLTGDPGSGKSAITASLAKESNKAEILWAQFFINRNNEETTDPKSYFPTIARQLADHIPDSEVAQTIHDSLKANKTLVDDISVEQAAGLFVKAVEVACKLDPTKAVLVVIDGLDESDRSRLADTAKIFSALFETLRCPNAKVFISSRTDDEIRRPFGQAFNAKYVKHVHLDTAAESSIRDVSTFMIRQIGSIVEENDLDWEEWPGEERMNTLCIRASGLFIWAVTAVKFIQSEVRESGKECLNRLLNALSSEGMTDINVLYGTILQITYEKSSEWRLETFRRIVGCITALREPLCIADIEAMLDLRETEGSDPVDVLHFVRRLRTVLVAGADAIDKKTIPRLHKSFFEFITSDHAKPELRVNSELSDGELSIRCLHQLTCFREDYTSKNPSDMSLYSISGALRYAVRFWGLHLPHREGSMSGIVVAASAVLLPSIRELLSSNSNIANQTPLGIHVSQGDADVLISWDKEVSSWDPKEGKQLKWPIQVGGSPSAVSLSPDGTRIVSGGDVVRLWDSRTCQTIGSPFEGHTDAVWSVTFSPDGTRIASGSVDKTIRLWDIQTGKASVFALEGYINPVWSVAFSPDGKHILSGSGDNSVRLWGVQKNRDPLDLTGHTDAVWSVSFSPDGRMIASGSNDHTIRLWAAVQGGQANQSVLQGHTNAVWCVAFSPDGARIVSGSGDKTVRLWDVKTGQPIGSALEGHTDGVLSVAFSPDGTRIVSASDDRTIRLWNVQSGRPVGLTFQAHTGWVSSMVPFPDFSRMISASLDGTVRIWDVQKQLGDPLISDAEGLSSVTISPDGTRIAAATVAGTVYLWDAGSRALISQVESSMTGITSTRFSSIGSELILSRVDGSVSRFNAKDGKPVKASVSQDNRILSKPNDTVSFDMQRGWQSGESGEALLHWLPLEDADAGLWAYVDGMLIRSNGPDSVSIFEMDGVDAKRRRKDKKGKVVLRWAGTR